MYNQRSAKIRQKEPVEVSIRAAGEDAFDAVVYIAIGHRLADLLNDERSFIPVRRDDGELMMLAKSQIASIVEKDAADPVGEDAPDEKIGADTAFDNEQAGDDLNPEKSAARKFDPYALLKIDPAASVDEIRAAYKARIKLVHPDSVAALGLDDDLAQAALRATQKLNYAYQKIMRERGNACGQSAGERASA